MFDVFQNVLAEIQAEISEMAFKTWFKNVVLVELDKANGVATIGVPNVFLIKMLENQYRGMIIDAFEHNNVKLERLDFVVKGDGKTRVKAREVTNAEGLRMGGAERARSTRELVENIGDKVKNSRISSSGLNSKYTLDNFVVGSSNELAAGVARLIAKNPGEKKFNPFFLYGGPGLGKTHLVQAVGNAILEQHPDMKVLYIPMNHFYSEFINAVRAGKGEEFVK